MEKSSKKSLDSIQILTDLLLFESFKCIHTLNYLTFAIVIHKFVSVDPNCAGERGWIKLSTGFAFGSEQRHLPCSNTYPLKKVHAEIFAQTDPVITFRPKGNTPVRTEVIL